MKARSGRSSRSWMCAAPFNLHGDFADAQDEVDLQSGTGRPVVDVVVQIATRRACTAGPAARALAWAANGTGSLVPDSRASCAHFGLSSVSARLR